MNIVLEDDDTPYGGVSFYGQTVTDFINEVDPNGDIIFSIRSLNAALKKCGIRQI